jgi:hypothetical protein
MPMNEGLTNTGSNRVREIDIGVLEAELLL